MKPRVPLLVPLMLGVAVATGHSGEPDLSRFSYQTIWRMYHRGATLVPDRPNSLRLDARENDGVAWLVGSDFTAGVIEVELRGSDSPGRSFVGLALRGRDDATFDAIYFRPFNFKNPEASRRAHAVQYVSMPRFPWEKLRADFPGRYEAALTPAPDPAGWFHVRLVADRHTLTVFVDHAPTPALVVTELTDRPGGWIGLWVGNNSGGDFADLRVTPKAPSP